MKRFLSILIILSLLFIFIGCSDNQDDVSDTSDNSINTTESDSKVSFGKDNLDILFSDPGKYKESKIEFTGLVFTSPEKDEDGTYLQVYADPENLEKNILVGIEDPNFQVKQDDYVKVTGVVKDVAEGENVFGAELMAPLVLADKIEVVDYITAVSPTLKTIDINESVDQHGFEITLEKIELAENETRVYIKAKNGTNEDVSLWEHSAKLIQDSKQYESEYNYEANYPELQSDLSPGIETEGIISFKPIDENIKKSKFIIEGSSDNYDIEINPFSFEFEMD
ncbi:MAG: DUF4352 domain-containing protein [Clostridia bacterium]|nr:DUF4352 domain-containing protein [Clostridia bacterium]